jgi:hypothetical protein
MRTTKSGSLFLYTGEKDWGPERAGRAQGHTASQHGQGLEPGLFFLGSGCPWEEGGPEKTFVVLYLRLRVHQLAVKELGRVAR